MADQSPKNTMKGKTKKTQDAAKKKRSRERAAASLKRMIAEAKPEAKPGRRKWTTRLASKLPVYDSRPESQVLLDTIRAQLPALKQLFDEYNGHRGYEDPVYRYYHGSFKTYGIQDSTEKIVAALQALMPSRKLNTDFTEIVALGTGKTWVMEHNKRWAQETRPMLEAYFHAKYFLDMAVRYGQELKRAPALMPSGWASILYLFDLR